MLKVCIATKITLLHLLTLHFLGCKTVLISLPCSYFDVQCCNVSYFDFTFRALKRSLELSRVSCCSVTTYKVQPQFAALSAYIVRW
jgi:hypothetical protein